ncbi:MAG: FhaA domain-containing protein [Acidimicrobiales bacterium]
MGLQAFERRLERMVEGVFARAFRSGLRPVELGRRLVRVMDSQRSVGVSGRPVVPNAFTVFLAPDDHEQFAEIADTLIRELCDAAREHARDEGYSFMGPISVELVVDENRRKGSFEVEGRLREGEGGGGPGSLLLPTGERVVLGEFIVTVGRMPESTLVLADPNVSRNHAEVRPQGDGYVVVDLGSTNGTRVNGVKVSEHVLRDGDEIMFGNTRVTFTAS